jgi:KDO2-lipid IV(A) lauroyltransferase
MISDAGKRPSLAPRNWGGWMMVGIFWLLGKLPLGAGLFLSRPLGALAYRAMGRRRAIARRNIERCFPEYSASQVEHLLRENFQALARAVFETGWCWGMSRQRFSRISRIEGLEHVLDAEEAGRGVLVITAHMTCLEMGARIGGEAVSGVGVYRPLRNEVVEWYQNKCRLSYAYGMISKREMRSAIRYLRKGGVLWYAPDQDFGPAHSQFVPFFGIQTATLEATARLVELTGCAVLSMFPRFESSEKRYVIRIQPQLQDFPSGDIHADLARVNRELEKQIRVAPEQYWWVHRRFKTRPEGEPPFYD